MQARTGVAGLACTDRLSPATTTRESNTANPLADLHHSYDNAGNITKVANTVTSAGQVIQRSVYDGFDHIVEHRANDGDATTVTKYAFDPFDRRQARPQQ